MATELGQAYVQIMPSAKGISGSIQKQLDPEADSGYSFLTKSAKLKHVVYIKHDLYGYSFLTKSAKLKQR